MVNVAQYLLGTGQSEAFKAVAGMGFAQTSDVRADQLTDAVGDASEQTLPKRRKPINRSEAGKEVRRAYMRQMRALGKQYGVKKGPNFCARVQAAHGASRLTGSNS